MATTIATLEAKLHADTKGFDKNMDKSESTFSKVGRNMGKIALGAGIAIAAGLAVGAKKSIEAASDLEEQINKTSVVFEGSAKTVQKWSKGLTRSFGLSQRAALEAAGTYGNMLKPMGLAPGLASKMSMKMVELAGDLASFNNASPEETLEALSSGIAGQTEPLRKFGVFLDAARVEQEALRLGLIKTGDALTPAAKAQATYSLILKDTTDAQGDFARTSKSLPNLMRTIKATIENLAARIGQKLLPVVALVIGQFEELLNFIDKVTSAGDLTLSIKIIWEGLKDLGGNLFDAVQKMLLGSAGTLKPLKLDSGKIIEFERVGASSGLVVSLQKMFEQINWGRIGQTIGENISKAIKVSSDWVGQAFTEASDWLDAHTDELAEMGLKIGLTMIKKLTDPAFWKDNWQLIGAVLIATFPLGRIVGLGGKIAQFLLRPIARTVPSAFGRIAARAIDEIGHQFRRLPPLVQEIFRRGAELAVRALSAIVKYLVTKFKAAFAKVPGWVQAAFRLGAVVGFLNIVRNIIDAVQDLIGWLSDLAGKISSMPSLPSLGDIGRGILGRGATGAIVTRPTLSVIGEAGPEAVVPLSRMPGASSLPAVTGKGGGGVTIVVQNHGLISSPDQVVNLLRNAVARWERSNGKAAFG